MNMALLKDVSLTGRIAYAIMCVEKYVTAKFPDERWKLVFDPFWEICQSREWDTWANKALEYIPEFLLEFADYESSNFEFISKDDYLKLKELYTRIDTDVVNGLLKRIRDIEEFYCYSSIDGIGQESLDYIGEIVSTLEREKIDLPDPELVSFSKFSAEDGWGSPFDGTKLSIVLVHDNGGEK